MNLTLNTINEDEKKITFESNAGLNLICGLTGSGKSSVLNAIQNEYQYSNNIILINDLFKSYVLTDTYNSLKSQKECISLILEALNICLNNETYNYKKIINFEISKHHNYILTFEDNSHKIIFSLGEKQLIRDIMVISYTFSFAYYFFKDKTILLTIDDFCNNFDLIITKNLCNWVLDKSKLYPDVHIVMTTQNRYVINAVPLKNISFIENTLDEFKIYNYSNSKENFDEFEYTGMGNFDCLNTKFYKDGFTD